MNDTTPSRTAPSRDTPREAPPRRTALLAAGGVVAGAALSGCQSPGIAAANAVAPPPTGPNAWIDTVRTEHRAALAGIDAMIAANDPVTREKLRMALADALTKHAVQEENVIYPALAMAGVQADASRLYAEHAQLKVMLGALDAMPKDHPGWADRARELRAIVAQHAQDEETRLYPAFAQRMTPEQNAALTARYLREGRRFG